MTKFSAPQQSQLAQIGAFLRDRREQQEKSLEDIAMRTYIRPQLLNGLEAGNPDVLPEPIFVQGFIRRYAEALGLNGIELSQQFTVDSIPSTPRPARPAEPGDSPTTRITRITPPQPAAPQPAAPQPAAPQPVPVATPIVGAARSLTPEQPDAIDFVAELESSEKAAIPYAQSAPADVEPSPVAASAPQPSEPAFVTIDDIFLKDEAATGELAEAVTSEAVTSEAVTSEAATSESVASEAVTSKPLEPETAAYEDNYADVQLPVQSIQAQPSEVSRGVSIYNFDGNGLNGHGLDGNETIRLNGDRNSDNLDSAAIPVRSSDSAPPIQDPIHNDELPEAFTIQAATPVMPLAANATEPVGVDYSRSKSTLMPFIIAGLAAVVAAGAAILFGLLGGGDSQPGIANRPDAVEQTTESAPSDALTEAPDAAPEETVIDQPPISTAPVYVEATATDEAWVSITADGDPTPIFVGTLQPGESQVWEAQEELIVYAGNAGALQLSANGEEATVMGEPGQPTEKIFP
ncbi:MAG: RodZ domain-containing protein [Phormidesmis sp.]